MKPIQVWGEFIIEENDTLYFSTFFGNGLYRYDKKTKKSKWLGYFKGQPKGEREYRLCGPMIKAGSKIFIAPLCGNAVINIYHIDTGMFELIDLCAYEQRAGEKTKRPFKFAAIHRYGESLYFIGLSFPAIVKVSLVDFSVEYIDGWADQIEEDYLYYCKPGVVCGKYGYFPFALTSALLKVNMEDGFAKVIKIASSANGFMGAAKGLQDDFWLLGADKRLCLNIREDGTVIEEVSFNIPIDSGKDSGVLKNPMSDGKGMYLYPVWTDHVYYFDFVTKEIRECQEFDEIVCRELGDKTRADRRLISVSARPDYVYLIEHKTKLWHEVCLSGRSYNSFEINQDIAYVWKNRGNLIYEGTYKLNDLLNMILN